MNDFTFYNPTRIIFGKNSFLELSKIIPEKAKILLLFGSGSIKQNGIYNKIISIIGNRKFVEYGGIVPNPTHEQCIDIQNIVEIKKNGINFILAVGGGSVIDAAKYIAVSSQLVDIESSWKIISDKTSITEALPIGVVLTIPGSGSEANNNAIISNLKKREKRSLKSEKIFPLFAILDPEVMKSLSLKQIAGGIIDTYSHVIEQYLTFPSNSPIQDRFSESILLTLLDIGHSIIKNPSNYDLRANLMYASSIALNGLLSSGVPQDWSSHFIAHELTAEYGISHPESIGIVLPGVINHMKLEKKEKLIQYAKRVFKLSGKNDRIIIEEAIKKTENFFLSLGQPILLSNFGLGKEVATAISKKIGKYPKKIGERRNIGEKEVKEILLTRI